TNPASEYRFKIENADPPLQFSERLKHVDESAAFRAKWTTGHKKLDARKGQTHNRSLYSASHATPRSYYITDQLDALLYSPPAKWARHSVEVPSPILFGPVNPPTAAAAATLCNQTCIPHRNTCSHLRGRRTNRRKGRPVALRSKATQRSGFSCFSSATGYCNCRLHGLLRLWLPIFLQ
ncbi:hypothetical protein U1Q18_047764, partial [Sarracenia purpurea var. burkii]